MIEKLIMFLCRYELRKIRKRFVTPYIFIREISDKKKPEYLMFTDDKSVYRQMHNIY